MKEYTKEQCESKILKWTERLENVKSDTGFKEGEWYKNDFGVLHCISKLSINDNNYETYGFTTEETWFYNEYRYYDNRLRPATDKEVEEALIKEAKKRGFKEGVKINQVPAYGCGSEYTIQSNKSCYQPKTQNFHMGTVGIYNNGKWAEIIEEPVYEYQWLVKIKGFDGLFVHNGFYINEEDFFLYNCKGHSIIKPIRETKRIRK